MASGVLRVLTWVDILLGLVLFFLLSGVVPGWRVFGGSGTRAFIFVVAMLLLANGIFFARAALRRRSPGVEQDQWPSDTRRH